MSILTGKEIQNRLGKDIIIEPFNVNQLNPNSYNLRLDNKICIYTSDVLDCKMNNQCNEYYMSNDGYLLLPNRVYLCKTMEYTETHNLVPLLDGRSSTGRLGLTASVDAGFGDIGFKGYWTLELSVIQPLYIYPGMEICQISYNTIEGEPSITYNGKYQGAKEIIKSKMYKDFNNN